MKGKRVAFTEILSAVVRETRFPIELLLLMYNPPIDSLGFCLSFPHPLLVRRLKLKSRLRSLSRRSAGT